MISFRASLMAFLALATVVQTTARAEDAKLAEVRQNAINFLKNSQADEGYWTAPNALGITALATTALLKNDVPASDPVVKRGLAYLKSYQQEDGGIYHLKSSHRNYETSISLLAFSAADAKENAAVITKAEKFLRGLQWDEGEGLESSDTGYGGAGYGGHKRPDLSNTQFMLEALKEAGVKADDPAMQKALLFVSRTQNLETEHNTTPFAAKIDDGGFYYTPAAGGTSQAGQTDNGGLRSYGSMTYAGLKSMIYAGLKEDDPRVKAAYAWLQRNYRLDENPGLGQQGLFYYYHTMAKTLDVLGKPEFETADGKKHNWRQELLAQLAKSQLANGSWVNKADRWYEGDPSLVTAYSLMALSYCDAPKAE